MRILPRLRRGRWPPGRLLATSLLATVTVTGLAAEQDPPRPLSQLTRRTWKLENGLQQDSIYAVAQTADGYLWLGTNEGLVRFDGNRFDLFDTRNVPALRHNAILCLEADGETLWIGTGGGGLVRYRGGDVKIWGHRDGLSDDVVRALSLAADGGVWVATSDGLSRLRDGRFETWSTADGLSAGHLSAVLDDGAGNVWIGTFSGGLNRLRGGEITVYTRRDGLPSDSVLELAPGAEGRVWVGTTRGLVEWNVERDRPERVLLEGLDVKSILATDRELWIGTFADGLWRLHGGDLAQLRRADGLASDHVDALLKGREGSLWAGTADGLSQLIETTVVLFTTRQGLPHDTIQTVLATQDESLWIGTHAGLARFRGGVFETWDTTRGLPFDEVWTLDEDGRGGLWIGTGGRGLAHFDGSRFRSYTSSDGLPNDFVRAVHAGRGGSVWIGTEGGGLARFDGAAFTSYTKSDGLPSGRVFTLHEDRHGDLWIGTGNGLVRFREGRFEVFGEADGVTSPYVWAIDEDEDGRLYFATDNGGLVVYRDGAFRAARAADGLFDDTIYGLLRDGRGGLWLSCSRGVARLELSALFRFLAGVSPRLETMALGRSDGFQAFLTSGGPPVAARAADGRLWFATRRGLAVIDPRQPLAASVAPPLRLTAITADAEPIDLAPEIEVGPGRRTVEIHYAAPYFLAPESLRFRYRLEDFDGRWMDAGSQRFARYTNLPPGSYTFRVAAYDQRRRWDEVSASVAVVVRPFFRQTPLFAALVAAGLLFATAGAYRLRVASLKCRNRRLSHEIEERRQAAAALRTSEKRFRNLFENANDAIVTFDLAGRFTSLNQAALDMLGYPEAEVLGREVYHLVAPEYRADVRRVFETADPRSFAISLYEHELLTRGGERVHVEVKARWLEGDGESQILAIARDVTGRRQLEERLRQSEKMEGIGQFTGGIAHDFNNLLTVIMGNAELLALESDKGANDEYLDGILKTAQSAAELTRKILAFSRKQVLEPEVLDLNRVVRDSERLLRRIIGEQIELRAVLAEDLARVRIDPVQIEQVILNLASNARDAMPDGGRLTIATKNVELDAEYAAGQAELEPGSYLLLEVRDTGHGMDAATRGRIFEPFFTTKERGKGTGLGLATVYGIVGQSGGHILVDSEPGEGTVMKLYFAPFQGEEPVAAEETAVAGGTETVLVLEDERPIRRVVRQVLRSQGYEVLLAARADEARTLADAHDGPIHLLITDVILPDGRGPDLARELVARRPETRVIFMSGYAAEEVVAAQGDRRFLGKPFTQKKLLRKIREVLDGPG